MASYGDLQGILAGLTKSTDHPSMQNMSYVTSIRLEDSHSLNVTRMISYGYSVVTFDVTHMAIVQSVLQGAR